MFLGSDPTKLCRATVRREAQNEIYVQLFQTPDDAEEVGGFSQGSFSEVLSLEHFGALNDERQEDNIRKLRKMAAGDEAESDKAAPQDDQIKLDGWHFFLQSHWHPTGLSILLGGFW